jgi:hypothetical protein
MSEMGDILEQMKALTLIAEGEHLTDLDRINLQMKMEDLRKQLAVTAGTPFSTGVLDLDCAERGGSSLLERARDRIIKGQEWNIREKFDTGFDPERKIENWERFQRMIEAGSFDTKKNLALELTEIRIGNESYKPVDGKWPVDVNFESAMKFYDFVESDPYEQVWFGGTGSGVRGKWVSTDDKNFLTVREKLEASNTIILMDAKSAAKGTERLDQKIDALQKIREEFAAFCESQIQAGNKKDASAENSSIQMYMRVAQLFTKIVDAVASTALPEAPELTHVRVELGNGASVLRWVDAQSPRSLDSRVFYG